MHNHRFKQHVVLAALLLHCWSQPVVASAIGDDDRDGVINARDACPATPAALKVDNRGCKQLHQIKQRHVIGIPFKQGSAYIHPKHYPELKALAQQLIQQPTSKLRLIGQVSAPEDGVINTAMPLERAKRVALVLVDKFKVPATRVSVTMASDLDIDKGFERRVIADFSLSRYASHRDYLAD